MTGPRTAAAERYRIRRRWWMGTYRYVRFRWHLLFAVLDLIGWALFGPAHVIARLRRLLRPGARPLAPRRILFVQLDHLGDAVLSSGMFAVLRRAYPRARIDVLCSPWNRELFELLPDVADVYALNHSRFTRRGCSWIVDVFWQGWSLRRKRYDLAMDVRGEFPHAVLMWLAGARRRCGWRAGGGGFLLTDGPKWIAGRSELHSRQAMLHSLGISCSPAELAPRFPSDESQLPASRPAIVLHVSAGTPAKRWPTEHWHELAARLIVEYGASLQLVGGRDGEQVAARLSGESALPNVSNLVGKTSVVDLLQVIRRADLFIGPDSGPAHLAAAVDTPAVVLFSGTNDPLQWQPWGPQVRVVRHAPVCSPCHRETCPLTDHPCMSGLQPARVMAAARSLLAKRFPSFPVWEHARQGDRHDTLMDGASASYERQEAIH